LYSNNQQEQLEMAKNSRGRNNNPDGRNQYGGAMSRARDNPFATAAAVGGAVAAGVFLWSRRNQISDQIGNIADQISEWREGMGPGGDFAREDTPSGGSGRNQAQISEEALTLKETGKTA
jgi:hypothetical protein